MIKIVRRIEDNNIKIKKVGMKFSYFFYSLNYMFSQLRILEYIVIMSILTQIFFNKRRNSLKELIKNKNRC